MTHIDLHTHSTASDGTYSPTRLIRAAHEAGLAAIALTDHDTTAGLPEAAAEAARLGVPFVPGIEMSAQFPLPGVLHILGLFIDPQATSLVGLSQILLEARNQRNPKIIARLQQLGCSIDMEDVLLAAAKTPAGKAGQDSLTPSSATSPVISRPHIAQALVAKGCVASIKQAFDVYLGPSGAAYFDKERVTPRQAMEAIHGAGGLAVLAHPVHLKPLNHAHLATLINHFTDAGLDAIEVFHPDHTPQDSEYLLQLARRYHLLVSGGSDFHGHNKPDISLGIGRGHTRIAASLYHDLLRKHQESSRK